MKKILLVLVVLLLFCGCTKKEEVKEKPKEEKKEEIIKDTYKDENNTPIGIYNLQGNTLTKLTKINKTPVVEQDLGVFQIYPSNEDTITLNKAFGPAFYDEWIKYQNTKLGFNLKFTLSDGRNISYNIFSPENTFDQWEYLMNYLYDDYNNFGKSFYSHIEKEQFNENTLMTSIKIQSSYSVDQINSKISLTVFTYDTEDDFENNEYRGNSSYTMDICLEGREC